MKTITTVLLSLILFVSQSFAADVAGLRALFEREFIPGYQEGRCGLNIDGFIKKAKSARVDLKGVTLLNVDGGGELYVNYARSRHGQPGSRAWFHHYIAVIPTVTVPYESERKIQSTDLILDFDYGNTPLLVPVKEYLETMYLSRRMWNNADGVRRDFTAGITSFSGVDAELYLIAVTETDRALASELQRQAVVIPKLKLRDAYLGVL